MVVDGHMDVLPAHAASAVGQVASDAMSWPGDAAQFLDIQMQQVAGPLMLVGYRAGAALGRGPDSA